MILQQPRGGGGMNWTEWSGYLRILVGRDDSRRNLQLLVPRTGQPDLSGPEAVELATVVHRRLFLGFRNWSEELSALRWGQPEDCLPILYIARWIARQQESNIAFWPPFNQAVIRGRIAPATVQQHLAPLLTDLWWKLHREWGIYRPQEGRVHVKWPQAHAGFTEGERDQLAQAVLAGLGRSEEPPDILYGDPDEFLHLLRTWLRHEVHTGQRLKRLILGPDGPAIIAAELIQRDLLASWPPKTSAAINVPLSRTPAPYIRIGLDPLSLVAVLPAGSIPGYSPVSVAVRGGHTRLATSYSDRPPTTLYPAYEWQLDDVPWPRDVILRTDDRELTMRIKPECPFSGNKAGALLFDPGSGQPVRRWSPNRQFLLLLPVGSNPRWLGELFSNVEIAEVGLLGSSEFVLLTASGKDLRGSLTRQELSDFLQHMEEELQAGGAEISLPDLNDLFAPEIELLGGTQLSNGSYPEFLASDPPAIQVLNRTNTPLEVRALRKEDDGQETLIGEGGVAGFEEALFGLRGCIPGSYVIRGAHVPKSFALVSEPRQVESRLEIGLKLLQSEPGLGEDDLRHFALTGVEIAAWPRAPITLSVSSEVGSQSYTLRMDHSGKKIVKLGDVSLPANANWVKLTATAWLATSPSLSLTLRPWIGPTSWELSDGRFIAQPDGVPVETDCQVWYVHANLRDGIQGLVCKASNGRMIDVEVPRSFESGWVVVGDSANVWLVARVAIDNAEFRLSFAQAMSCEIKLPDLIWVASRRDVQLRELCCLLCLASLSRHLPSSEEVPEELEKRLGYRQMSLPLTVKLPLNWGNKLVRLENQGGVSGKATLVLGGRRYPISVQEAEDRLTVVWSDPSGPCRCSDCGEIMSQSDWYRHGHASGLTVLDRRIRVAPGLDWLTYIDAIYALLVRAIEQQVDLGEPWDLMWKALQESYRQRRDPGIPPEGWVAAVVDGWKTLLALRQHSDHSVRWTSLWEKWSDFEAGIRALSLATR